jgi:hypothetical protein
MENLDIQFIQWKNKLIEEVKIPLDKFEKLATTIRIEIEMLTDEEKQKIRDASPVDLKIRLEELHAFQVMMDTFNKMKPRPEIVRTQVIAQNYICFVYLKDTLFEILKKVSQPDSISRKCCKYLLNNPVRAFRNSIAHGNWKYKSDFSGFEFWAYKGEPNEHPMDKWEVSGQDLNFWQQLSRAVAYTAYLSLTKEGLS